MRGKKQQREAEAILEERKAVKKILKRKGPNPLDDNPEPEPSLDELVELLGKDDKPAPKRENDGGPFSRVIQIKSQGKEIGVTMILPKKTGRPTIAQRIALSASQERSIMVNLRVSKSIQKAMRARAEKYCEGNMSEWLIWAALEFTPKKHTHVLTAEV